MIHHVFRRHCSVYVWDGTKQQVIKLMNDPFQLAISGSLTMVFLICGFPPDRVPAFWVLLLRRALQLGVVRAMGPSFCQLKRMILYEQLLTSGAGIAAGVFVGFLTSRLFIPFFQLSFSSTSQIPPFRVVTEPMDIVRVFIFVGIMMAVGCGVLIVMISKLKLSNVIKRGED